MEFVAQAPVIKEQHVQTWTIPGLDPELSDHLAAEMQDSTHFQLSPGESQAAKNQGAEMSGSLLGQ